MGGNRKDTNPGSYYKELSGLGFNRHQSQVRLESRVVWVATGRTPILGHTKEPSGLGFNGHQSHVRLRSMMGLVVTGWASILDHADEQGNSPTCKVQGKKHIKW